MRAMLPRIPYPMTPIRRSVMSTSFPSGCVAANGGRRITDHGSRITDHGSPGCSGGGRARDAPADERSRPSPSPPHGCCAKRARTAVASSQPTNGPQRAAPPEPRPHAPAPPRPGLGPAPLPSRALAGLLTTSPHPIPPPHPATRRKPHAHRPYRPCGPGRFPSTPVRAGTASHRGRTPGGKFRIARSHERPAPLRRTVHATSHSNAPSPGATDTARKWPRHPLPRASTPAHRSVVADHEGSRRRSSSAAPAGRTG